MVGAISHSSGLGKMGEIFLWDYMSPSPSRYRVDIKELCRVVSEISVSERLESWELGAAGAISCKGCLGMMG